MPTGGLMKYLACLFLFLQTLVASEKTPYVTVVFQGQLGNNLFQVAAASALAWDNGAVPLFPGLLGKGKDLRKNYKNVLFRCDTSRLPVRSSYVHKDREEGYVPISYQPNMTLQGYFVSEQYFAHHRERILELFAPREEDLAYIEEKYGWILEHPNAVGVQVRFYHEDSKGNFFIQYGKDYFTKAMALFPEDTLFVVSSDNIPFARSQLPNLPNVVYLTGEPYHIDFYLLSMCKDNIISNSTFGWWAAWLNQNPDKIVVHPKHYFHPNWYGTRCPDTWPEEWVEIDAKWGGSKFPNRL